MKYLQIVLTKDMKVFCPETYSIKLLEDNIGENVCELGLGKDFSDTTSKTQSKKGKNLYIEFNKIS